ncbi:sensor histidine kinase [Streptomyces phaeochromogenes]|uniref:sensor histidine kinase n=1 Tax=Streptomyces phaeochromogenes TaxID=1923 RepID=UPI002E153DCE|nr:histidine kinase [Streptomyces phaeochromogenes]WSJ02861.1 histidine kinase [Streptomyces phaeochromogenes]
METEDRRERRRQLRDALRPEEKPAPLSRWAVRADVVLAIVLTVIALIVAAQFPGDGPARVSTKSEQRTEQRTDHRTEVPPVPPVPPRPRVPGVGLVEPEPRTVPWPLVVLSALPLAARRRYPLVTFGIVMGAALPIGDDASWINVLTCVIGAYSAVMYSRYQVRALAGMVVAAVLAGFAFRETDPVLPGWSSPAVVLLVAGVLAGLVRVGGRRLTASRDRFTQLQRDQEEAMRRAVEEERARIAAELHDVVTHNVSVMVIQAGAARKVMDTAPERSKEALLAVEAGGRAAMSELRHVMGLLAAPDTGRPDSPADGLEPQPGLGHLDALIERVRAAGTPVAIAVSRPPEPLPPGVDLAAYRVVQEALTNTIKHAPGADASVTIGHTDDCLEIEVTDTGAAHDAPSTGANGTGTGTAAVAGNGRGLIGLRERLTVYGGELTAGPTLAGGYRIRARVPWRTA